MPVDTSFLKRIEPLYSKAMGAELIGPLIYSLIRSVRPTKLLEVGAGYTTPFMLLALHENDQDYQKETTQVAELIKTEQAKHMNFVPEYYHSKNRRVPLLHTIDNFSHGKTSADRVSSAVEQMGLSKYLQFIEGDFRGFAKKIVEKDNRKFDFVWFDCGGPKEYADFIDEYWPHIDGDGGMLLLHSTLTNISVREIHGKLKLRQATTEFNNFEMLSLLEPHKRFQNSVTLIRMTSEYRDRTYP